MINQVTDMQSIASTLRRRSRLLAAAALLGFILGFGYVLALPPPVTSTTLVLLPTPAVSEVSNSDIDTQVRIALSATILERAGQAVAPPLSARSVKKMVDISAPTNQVLQIEATSRNGAKAQKVSQAMADAYVGYVSNTAKEVTAAALADLTTRRDDLKAEIAQLDKEILASTKRQKALNPNSPEGIKEAQLIAALRAQHADFRLQLDRVEDKIVTGGLVESSSGTGTSVMQPATVDTGMPLLLRLLFWGSLGGLTSTVLAAIILLATASRDPRLRLRDDIADAVGSSVLAAAPGRPQVSVAGWSTLLETYEATPVEAWAFRQVLRGVAPGDRAHQARPPGKVDHPQSLTVISIAGDEAGLSIGPQLAAFASSLGIRTRLVTGVGHEWAAAALWAACAVEHKTTLRPDLYLADVPAEEAIDMTITLVVVDRAQPNLGEAPSAATILSVAAATATEQELARVAVAVDDSGQRVDGIVVADPDRTDRTSGRHTMDERSRRPTLPTRLTGISSSERVAADRHRSRS